MSFQTEGTYTLKLSLFNPLDGWMDTDDILIEVLSQCGPITIDDWGVITDAVSLINGSVFT